MTVAAASAAGADMTRGTRAAGETRPAGSASSVMLIARSPASR
jgi:hypothetical protein